MKNLLVGPLMLLLSLGFYGTAMADTTIQIPTGNGGSIPVIVEPGDSISHYIVKYQAIIETQQVRILLSPGTDLYVSPETGQLGWMRAEINLPETYLKYGGQKIGITHSTISFYDNLKLHEIHGLNECLNVYVRNGYWAKGNGYMVFYPSGQLKVLFADGDSCRSTVKVQGRAYPYAWLQGFDENGYVTGFHRSPWLIKPILLRQKTNCSISYFQSYKKSHLDCPY